MQIDRSTQTKLNAIIGGIVVASLGGLAWMVLSRKRIEHPLVPPEINRDLQSALQRAAAAEEIADYPEAQKWYGIALKMKPDRGDIAVSYARVVASGGNLNEAWPLYQQIVDRTWSKGRRPGGANDVFAWYADLATLHGQGAKADALAVAALPYSLRGSPKSRTRMLAAFHLYGANAVPLYRASPLGHLRRAATLDRDWILPHLALAKIAFDAKRSADVEKEYQTARLIAQKGTGTDWLTFARFDANRQLPKELEADFREAERRIAPGDTKGWLDYYFSDSEFRKPNQSARLIEKVKASAHSNDPESLLTLAEFYGPRAKAQAEPLAKSALRSTTPQQTKRYARIAMLLNGLGQRQTAISMLRQTIPYANATDRQWLQNEVDELNSVSHSRVAGSGSVRPSIPYSFPLWLERELFTFEDH